MRFINPPTITPLPNRDAIAYAKRVGTYGKIDRSAQYQGRYSPEALLRNDNLQFRKLREIERMHLRNAVIVALVSAVLARAPEIAAWVTRLMK